MWRAIPLSVKSKSGIRGTALGLLVFGLLFGSGRVAHADDTFAIIGQVVYDYALHLHQQTSATGPSLRHVLNLYRFGDYDQALGDVNRLLQNTPDSVAAHNLRGLIYMAQGQYGLAVPDFDIGVAADRDRSETRFNRGLALLHLTHYAEAVADFTQVISANADNYDAFHYRALCYYNLHDYTRASEDYGDCVRIRPAEPAAYRNRALALLHSEKFADAIDCLNVYIGFNPTDSEAYFNRGMAFVHLDRIDRAIVDLTRFTNDHPENANAWFQLALCFLNRADREWEKAEDAKAGPDYAQAVTDFHEVIKRHKENACAFFNIGQACIKLAKVTDEETPYKEAQTALETFLQLSPNDLDAPAVRQQLEQIRSRLSSRQ